MIVVDVTLVMIVYPVRLAIHVSLVMLSVMLSVTLASQRAILLVRVAILHAKVV